MKKTKVILMAAIMMLSIATSALPLLVGASNTQNPYLVRTFFDEKGQQIDEIIVPERPPEIKATVVMVPETNIAMGINVLSNVPAFDWCYGCSATAAAMMFGHYDNTVYPSMYAGPTNGGVCPMTNSPWGSGECPLSATHQGYDGLTEKGHVDDYWYSYGSSNDPYYGNWAEHGYAECTADYMGTNQYYNWQNTDGSTRFYFYKNGAPLYDYTGCESGGKRDGCRGMRLFVESRGYNVFHDGSHYQNYNQYIYGYNGNTQGFTFDDFKSEIDAGRPVIIQVEGHSMLGYGYNTAGNKVYIHNTWDHSGHQMTWGGTYSGMQHYGVAVIRLSSTPKCDGTDTSCGIHPNCENCNDYDDCWTYGNGCEERNYYCYSNEVGCDYTYSNRHTDGWYDTGSKKWVTTKEYECKYDQKEQKEQEYRDYYCSGGSCTHKVTGTPQWIDTGNTQTVNKPDGTDCGTDGWMDSGEKKWIDDPGNECKEKEQKKQEYRDYSCSAGNCDYSVTETKWIDTGTTRNKPDGTDCGCTANNTLKKCYEGSCSDKGICNSTICGADIACDGKKPGEPCGANKKCSFNCKCGVITPMEDIAIFRNGGWHVDTDGDHITDIFFGYGTTGDIPVVGDINQDGTDDTAIFRNGGWHVDTNGDHVPDQIFGYGIPGDTPVVGDINQDGTDDIAIFRDGGWHGDTDGDHVPDQIFEYGTAGDTPVVGDIDQVGTVPEPPNITSFAPPSPVNDTVCNWRTFNVIVNQTVNVSWYLNGSLLDTDESVREANYTLHAEVPGEHNVSAIASNINGRDMQTWVWNVTTKMDRIGVFRDGIWHVDTNGDHVPDLFFPYGTACYTPVVGDINQDGTDDIAIFRDGGWHVDTDGDHIPDLIFSYGTTGDIPVIGDINQDGNDDTAIFRNGGWHVDTNGDHITDIFFGYGIPGDTPVVGDINQDGIDDTVIFRNGGWHVDADGDHILDIFFPYGTTGDIPVIGDINQDGTDDTAIFRDGGWHVDTNGDHITDIFFGYGTTGDTPVVGDIG